MAALDKSFSINWWRWHISVSQLCYYWSMAVSFWVASITVCMCFGVPPWECQSLNYSKWLNIKLLVKLGKSGNEIREMLVQVYGDNAMKKTAVYMWVKHFSEARESVTDEERSGRPATSRTEENIAKDHQIVRENRRLTVRSIAEQENTKRDS